MQNINVRASITRIKIDRYGNLWMERYGNMKPVYCHISERSHLHCNDHCRLFHDPIVYPFIRDATGEANVLAFMENCNGSITKLDGYIEERE